MLVAILSGITTLMGVRVIEAATELARVNSTVITLEDFNKKYRENLKYFQIKFPTKKNVLDDLIKRELAIQEAKKSGLDKDPDVIDRMNTVLFHSFIDKKLGKEFENINISDADAKAYYTKFPELRTSHIFVAVRPDATPEQQRKAYEKIKEIQDKYLRDGKMSFAEVAQRHSEGIAAPMGGDIDYMNKDKLDQTYYDAAVKLKSPGKVSGIIRTQFGYHIVKLTAVRPWEEVDKPMIKRAVFEERKAEIFERYMTQLRSSSKVSVKSELLGE